MTRKGMVSVHDWNDPEAMRRYFDSAPRRPIPQATDAGVLPDGAVLWFTKPKRKSKSSLSWTQRRVQQLYQRDGAQCWYCGVDLLAFPLPKIERGRSLPERYPTVDEVIPRCKGGKRSMDNQRVACHPCNTKKGSDEPSNAVIARAASFTESPEP